MNWKRRILVIILILAVGWTLTAPMLANYLVVQKHLDRADAIVVLSGSAEFLPRTREAALIFEHGAAPYILLTDDGLQGPWDGVLKRNPTTVERARSELVKLGVPDTAIEVLPTVVDGTRDEANVVATSVGERHLRSVILVTSAYHSRRALCSFEQALRRQRLSLDVGIRSPSERSGPFWWLSFNGWRTVGLEWIKTTYYAISA